MPQLTDPPIHNKRIPHATTKDQCSQKNINKLKGKNDIQARLDIGLRFTCSHVAKKENIGIARAWPDYRISNCLLWMPRILYDSISAAADRKDGTSDLPSDLPSICTDLYSICLLLFSALGFFIWFQVIKDSISKTKKASRLLTRPEWIENLTQCLVFVVVV